MKMLSRVEGNMIKLAYIYQTNDFLAGFYRWQKLVGRGILSYHRIFAICIGYVFFSFQMQQYRIIKKNSVTT